MPINNDVQLGKNVKMFHPEFVNRYGFKIDNESKSGTFSQLQKNGSIRRCKISSHSFLWEGVAIEDEVFIGHGVMFTNDIYPRSSNLDGSLQTEADWAVIETCVKRGASIGSNATILTRLTICERASIGAGAVVTRAVAD
nr:acyltransferase [Chamaesiphon polymorphus]